MVMTFACCRGGGKAGNNTVVGRKQRTRGSRKGFLPTLSLVEDGDSGGGLVMGGLSFLHLSLQSMFLLELEESGFLWSIISGPRMH